MIELTATLLTTYRGSVIRDWVDYNGHMRDAFYLLLFSYASDTLMERVGMDAAGRAASGHSMYTLECHLNYLHEVKEGASVEVHTQILGADAKRLHIYQGLYLAEGAQMLAGNEMMLLNVDSAGPRAAPFVAPVMENLRLLLAQHRTLPRPSLAGRSIALPGQP